MHATYNTWNLVISGKDKTYQCPGAHCIEIAILTFTKGKSVTAIYLQIENMTGLSYLVRIGGEGGGEGETSQSITATSSLGNMGPSVSQSISVTAEYLPNSLNIQADWQSRNHKDSSDWKLNPKIFPQIVKNKGMPQIDLFASQLKHQLPIYMSWHPDPGSCVVYSLQQSWRNLCRYAFPPFCLIGKVLAKVESLFLLSQHQHGKLSHGTQHYSQSRFNIPYFYPI